MRALLVTLIACLLVPLEAAQSAPFTVQKRSRADVDGASVTREATETWQPEETAIIVCDMWDSHHCLNAVRRCVELAPRMNQVLEAARGRGVLIIHAPSSCMAAYENHPGRKLAQSAPQAGNLPVDIGQWCRSIPAEEKGIYPIDQTKGGEDDDPADHEKWQGLLAALGRNPKSPWKSQLASLTIGSQDAISDSGVEVWNLLEARKIKNVILLGVHTNMCVLGRPFGLRQMAKNGKNVVLMRDMTDTMYDPSQPPYVNHFTGTHLIIEHIEKYVCPTITSVAFLGGEAFHFARDRRKIAMIIGEEEYKTEVSLPAFVKSDLEPLGFEVRLVQNDPQNKDEFPGMAEAIRWADLVFISVRRHMPAKADLAALREHIAAGKPVVGIRTVCHAWCQRDPKKNEAAAAAGRGVWPEFDPEVIGGHYTNHYPNGPKSAVSLAPGAAGHAILRGVEVEKLVGNGSLYQVKPLVETAQALLMGAIPDKEAEPIAWTNLAGPKKARVFFTSLGHEGDFQNPAFRKLLVNGVFWAIEDPYPVGQDLEKLLPSAK